MAAVSTPTRVSDDERALSSVDAGLSHLRMLLATSRGDAARAFASELSARYPESEAVAEFVRVLTPPGTRPVAGRRGRCLDRDYDWLREHAREYPGCWLAVYEDKLVAAARDLKSVVAKLRDDPGHEQALLHFEPERAE